MNHFIANNQVSLLCNGYDYFPALIAAIQNARHEIYLQTYIYTLDRTGENVGEALQQAARRGVSVYLLLDGFGSRALPKTYVTALKSSGIEVLFFRPKISPWTLKRSRLRRLHSKVAVIDGMTAFVGGINIIDDYNTPSHIPPRIDYAVKIEGALLKKIHANAKHIWRSVCLRQGHITQQNTAKINSFRKTDNGMRAAFLVRDNLKHRRDIENAYLSTIKLAKSEIIIANAYFLPGLRFRHALRDAVVRGVTVKLILQQRTEYFFLDFATRALYTALLSQGIHIYEYHKSHMHSKVAIIDQHFSIVGSSNIDPFSLFLSLEANVVIDSKVFSEQLKQHLLNTIETGSVEMTKDQWQRGYYLKRTMSWMVYSLVKLMLAVIGYPENI
ncbi:MAG TPA: cardiolipin synthase ClsB [Methylophilaceae bacterium]|nr:cardiolipin synthase ClsB [Methylophilaceae bacterium]